MYIGLVVCVCCSLIPCGNHAQLKGGSGAKRLMSTLAYGWVERCSDIASCGAVHLQGKCSLVFSVFNFCNCICLRIIMNI